jgi:hypothetical protein
VEGTEQSGPRRGCIRKRGGGARNQIDQDDLDGSLARRRWSRGKGCDHPGGPRNAAMLPARLRATQSTSGVRRRSGAVAAFVRRNRPEVSLFRPAPNGCAIRSRLQASRGRRRSDVLGVGLRRRRSTVRYSPRGLPAARNAGRRAPRAQTSESTRTSATNLGERAPPAGRCSPGPRAGARSPALRYEAARPHGRRTEPVIFSARPARTGPDRHSAPGVELTCCGRSPHVTELPRSPTRTIGPTQSRSEVPSSTAAVSPEVSVRFTFLNVYTSTCNLFPASGQREIIPRNQGRSVQKYAVALKAFGHGRPGTMVAAAGARGTSVYGQRPPSPPAGRQRAAPQSRVAELDNGGHRMSAPWVRAARSYASSDGA